RSGTPDGSTVGNADTGSQGAGIACRQSGGRPIMSHARVARGEQGSALLLALFFTILALGLVAVGSTILRSHRTKTETAFRHNSQAMQFARSGLTEAVAWFRRQTAQPVLDFRPIVDPAATPPITDTDDP